MSDGRIVKPDKDYTKEADKQIPEAQELAKVAYRTGFPREYNESNFLGQCTSSYREASCAGKADETGTACHQRPSHGGECQLIQSLFRLPTSHLHHGCLLPSLRYAKTREIGVY